MVGNIEQDPDTFDEYISVELIIDVGPDSSLLQVTRFHAFHCCHTIDGHEICTLQEKALP